MEPILRTIDATRNRASEGLRVLEDLSRFTLNDRALTDRIKRARHDLRARIDAMAIDPGRLVASRDTPGDVGTDVTTPGELDRGSGVRDLVSANAKRAQEALRTLEECAKALGRGTGGFDAIRYTLYDIERSMLMAILPACPRWALCVLVTIDACVHHTPAEIVRRAHAGGADCVQIREKSLADGALLDHCARMVDVCRSVGIGVMVNDRPDIAALSGADGVHLGQDDLPIHAARAIIGHGKWIGMTCATLDDARRAARDGADTLGLGPVFASGTKPKPVLAGLGLLGAVRSDPVAGVPANLAISGITPTNAGSVYEAGAVGVAVCGAVCGAEDPGSVCRAIVSARGMGAESAARHPGHATIAP